jgi:peptidoglycan-associated lipoprotein
MRRNRVWMGLIALVLCLSVTFLIGCAKKATLREEAVVTKEQKAVAQASSRTTMTEAAAQESSMSRKSVSREQAPRVKEMADQTVRDGSDKAAAKEAADKAMAKEAADKAAKEAANKAAREAADKAAREAVEKAKKEAAEKAAAIQKELQIADINFDFDKSNLRPEAQEVLKKGTPAYLKYRDYKLVIEGHCDERGTAEYNLALGEKRATEAAKYLTDLGIDKDRIKTISYGKEMPLDKGHDEDAWAKNRRDHFVLLPPAK